MGSENDYSYDDKFDGLHMSFRLPLWRTHCCP